MKKFLIILSICSIILSSICLPVFADTIYTLPAGDYTVRSSSATWLSGADAITISLNFTSNNEAFKSISFVKRSDGSLTVNYNLPISGQAQAHFSKWHGDYKTISVLEDTTLTETEYLWFSHLFNVELEGEKAPEPECDGSICHVADFNTDGVCDTCGYTLAVAAYGRLYTPTNWPSMLPSPPLGFDETTDYIVTSENTGGIYLFTWTPRESYSDFNWQNKVKGSQQIISIQSFDGQSAAYMTYYKYKYNASSDSWELSASSQSQNSTSIGVVGETSIIYSTLDIYYEDGTPFFPLPLTGAVQEVIRQEVQMARVKLTQTMVTLTIAGLGSLVLLMGLYLLHKKFRTFLP